MMDKSNITRSQPPDHRASASRTRRKPAKTANGQIRCRQKLDESLDRGLEDTFAGSDPVAVTQPPRSAHDKRKP